MRKCSRGYNSNAFKKDTITKTAYSNNSIVIDGSLVTAWNKQLNTAVVNGAIRAIRSGGRSYIVERVLAIWLATIERESRSVFTEEISSPKCDVFSLW